MATIISRLFSAESAARRISKALQRSGFPRRDLYVFAREGAETQADLVARMCAAGLAPDTAQEYADAMASGGAVFAVRATYKPLMAKTIARDLLDRAKTVDVGPVDEEAWIKDAPEPSVPSILSDHPRFFTRKPDGRLRNRPLTAKDTDALLVRRKPNPAAILPAYLRRKPFVDDTGTAAPQRSRTGPITARLSFLPLRSDTKQKATVIPGGGLIFGGRFGLPSVIRR